MAVEPNEILGVEEEVAGEPASEEEAVVPSDKPPEPELAEGAVVPLSEFQRLQENVSRLQSTLDTRAAQAEARAEEAEVRAEKALKVLEARQHEMERNAEAFMARSDTDEEERKTYQRQYEAWRNDSRAEIEAVKATINVPARERRKVAQKYGIDVKELGELEDPVEMRDKALEVLKAQRKEEPEMPAEPETPRRKPTTKGRGPLQPTGGTPFPKPKERVTPEMISEAARSGDIPRVKELRRQLAEQRREDEKAAGIRR